MRMAKCHIDRQHYGRDLCKLCYDHARRAGDLGTHPKGIKKIAKIPSCHPDRPYQAHGLCKNCYLSMYYYRKGCADRKSKSETSAGRARPIACEVCKGEQAKMCWDHNHKTGKFRGWLCQDCNFVLGLVRDSANQLRALAQYLDSDGIGPGPTASRELNQRQSLESSFIK